MVGYLKIKECIDDGLNEKNDFAVSKKIKVKCLKMVKKVELILWQIIIYNAWRCKFIFYNKRKKTIRKKTAMT